MRLSNQSYVTVPAGVLAIQGARKARWRRCGFQVDVLDGDVVNSQVAMENGHLCLIYIDLLWKMDENM